MRPVHRTALLALLIVAALPATARAGGWATVEAAAPPAGLNPGEPWRAELLVKQHGVTPLDGLSPTVRIENDAGASRTFRARPAGRAGGPGMYVATVTYPSAGTWRTRIFDGFTDALPHRLPPVTIGASGAETPAPAATPDGTGALAASRDGGGPPWPQIIAIAAIALMFVVGFAATFPARGARGRRRTAPRAVA
jgi:hypothetical protein